MGGLALVLVLGRDLAEWGCGVARWKHRGAVGDFGSGSGFGFGFESSHCAVCE